MIRKRPRIRLMSVAFRKIVEPICRSSARRPAVWLLAALLVSIPAALEFSRIGLDTNLVRLLPTRSPASRWTRALESSVSDQGYFTILFEGENRDILISAVEEAAVRVRSMKDVHSAEYEYPLDFIQKYRYFLVPDYYLEKILDYLISLEAEVSPLGEDLLSDETGRSTKDNKEEAEMKELLDRYSHLTRYHESRDGRVLGLFIRPRVGLTSLGELRRLWLELEDVAAEGAARLGIWAGVGGSQIENLREFDVIVEDLKLSGAIASALILFFLLASFGTWRALPPLLFPLGLGLLWSFSLVPPVLGDLNIITSFLVLVLFGMGIDFSIHLVRRFQIELAARPPEEALAETFYSTGSSVAISGGTTALALFVLSFSEFRGFSEYGLICGTSLALILLAMFVVMPSTLVLGHRLGLLRPVSLAERKARLPLRILARAVGVSLAAAVAASALGLRFDYDFNSLKPARAKLPEIERTGEKVYSRYMSPGAVYVAPDLASLDAFLEVLEARRRKTDSLIKRISDIRDFVPNEEQAEVKFDLIDQIREQVRGAWTRRIEDPDVRHWIEDIQTWNPPARQAASEELPAPLRSGFETWDGSGEYVIGIYPSVPRGNGRNAMRFTRELYDLEVPAGIKGPVGEMPVFAEILWVVSREGPWVVAATFLSVLVLVFLGNRSIGETLWTIFPLVGGMVLAFGVLAVAGIRLNFFNVVVIPTLIGLGEDHGVHYFRRWKELGRKTAEVHKELWGSLTACTVTTMLGYSGMVFASHRGLRSIGLFAVIGMACIWVTSLVLFPAMLESKRRRGEARRLTGPRRAPRMDGDR